MPFFIPDLSVILAFALATVVLAVTPGPDMALQMSRAINYGRAHGLAAMFGAMAGILVHTMLVAFGISILIIAAPPLFLALKIAGAVYLLWLAYQAVFHGGGLRLAEAAKKPPTVRQSFMTGVGINLLNPKVVLFFVTFLPQFVDAHDPGATGKLIFLGLFFIVVGMPINIIVILAADKLAAWLQQNPKVLRGIDYTFAGVFSVFAMKIFFTQAK